MLGRLLSLGVCHSLGTGIAFCDLVMVVVTGLATVECGYQGLERHLRNGTTMWFCGWLKGKNIHLIMIYEVRTWLM